MARTSFNLNHWIWVQFCKAKRGNGQFQRWKEWNIYFNMQVILKRGEVSWLSNLFWFHANLKFLVHQSTVGCKKIILPLPETLIGTETKALRGLDPFLSCQNPYSPVECPIEFFSPYLHFHHRPLRCWVLVFFFEVELLLKVNRYTGRSKVGSNL